VTEANAEQPAERSASATALGVATLRAAHLLLDDPPPILDDQIAIRLLDPGAADRIREHADAFRTPGSLGLRSHVVGRSRHAEDRLQQAVARGVRQALILGAGLDTFAYRQPAWARELWIFELDHPASQSAKRARLEAAGIGIPSNVAFVAVNLDADPLIETLVSAGFDASAPSFISCLGVLPYLDPATVERVFRLAAALPPSSEMVATFARPAIPGFDHLAEGAAKLGEPWRTRFEPGDLKRRLSALGFSSVSFLLPEEAQARYFRDRRDGLRATRRINTIIAVV
jgi:methyltransferase (TIGR00027 family)